jgi:hypothetical protein
MQRIYIHSGVGGNLLSADIPPRDKNPQLYEMLLLHKVGCKCFLWYTDIGCLLASTASFHPNSPISQSNYGVYTG